MEKMNVSILNAFPPVDEAAVDALLDAEITNDKTKLVVLDDAPTGVQTVHDISESTDWSVDSIRMAFAEENKVFYSYQFPRYDSGRDHKGPQGDRRHRGPGFQGNW